MKKIKLIEVRVLFHVKELFEGNKIMFNLKLRSYIVFQAGTQNNLKQIEAHN